MTASKELLAQLHDMVGKELLKRIQSGEATASEFAQAIKFLKDNGIEAIPAGNSALAGLASAVTTNLPFTTQDDQYTH